MKTKKYLIAVSCFLIGSLLISCKGDKGDAGTSGLKGDIWGKVFIEIGDNLYYRSITTVISGFKVEIKELGISSITNEKGEYLLQGVRTGTYDITASLDGYNTVNSNISFLGGGNATTIGTFFTTRKKSTTEILSLEILDSLSPSQVRFVVTGKFNQPFNEAFKGYAVVGSKYSNVNPNSFYNYFYQSYYRSTDLMSDGKDTVQLNLSNIGVYSSLSGGYDTSYYEKGKRVYLVAFSSSRYAESDFFTGNRKDINANPTYSNVVSFVKK